MLSNLYLYFHEFIGQFNAVGLTDIPMILSVIILASLLSLDNSLVVAAIASKLPVAQQKVATDVGLGIGIFLRLVALLVATWVIQYPAIKVVGALYLLYVAYKSLFGSDDEDGSVASPVSIFAATTAIILADCAFSIDNVVGTIAMSTNLSVILIGTLLGGIAMIVATRLVSILLQRYELLEKAAYVIVGFVGITILAEVFLHINISEILKFIVVVGITTLTIIYEEIRIARSKV
jgi:predicted tellurium resistance membrane protein TerC